jgi:translocation and assembly module TamB
MPEAVATAGWPPPPPPYRLKRNWLRRLLYELATLLLAIAFLLAVGLAILDTAPGHRWVADQIGKLETASGLKIRIGRIEGSVFGQSRLRNVAVLDQHGIFFTSPEIDLDWAPGAWLYHKLDINRVHADRAILVRLPKLKPSTSKAGPILPRFDIHIGELSIHRLDVGPEVSGTPRSGRLRGSADVRAGRAIVNLGAAIDGSDQLRVKLDAEPDGNRFDLETRAQSRADGVLPAIFGMKRSLNLVIGGNGTWTKWRGSAALNVSKRPAGRLALSADNGRFGLSGVLGPSQFLTGRLQHLTAPVIKVRGEATLKDRVLDGQLALGSAALRAVASGSVDLGQNSYRHLSVGVDLLQPKALFDNMSGQKVRLVWTLEGPFATADYAYRLTSPAMAFDQTGFVDVMAQGRAGLSPWPMRVPLHLQARDITGVGDTASAILGHASLDGIVEVTPKLIRGEGLQLKSDKLAGKLSLLVDLETGNFQLLLSGGLKRYFIEGLGIVDVLTDLRVVPGPGGHGSLVTGTAKAWVRRLDNSFFASLTGGLPWIQMGLTRTPDGLLHLTNLQLYSPKLRLAGEGVRNTNGTFHITASGRQATYGPLRLVLDGDIARPRVDLFLQRPNDSLGLSNVHLLLNPVAAGYNYKAAGGSRLGPFTGNGQILFPHLGPTIIAVSALKVGATTATGSLAPLAGGLAGNLNLSGGGLNGSIGFAPVEGAQRIDLHLAAANASFPGALTVVSGRLDGTILLGDAQTTVNGVVNARGVELSGMSLDRIEANANLVNGSGQVRAVLAGRRGAAFQFSAVADVSPDRIAIGGRGSVERQPLVLEQPAVLTASGDGWALAPTRVAFGGGHAVVSGNSGSTPSVHAQLEAMPLQVLNILSPNLDLGGLASGSVDYAWKGERSGRMNLTVRGLSRSGLVLASQPIDVGIAAVLTGDKAGMRAVAVAGGQTIGRAQALFSPLGQGPVVEALMNAPLFAQLRYAGPADTLWRLSGIEVFDLTGPAAIGADIHGTLANPTIGGSLHTQNARIESPVTGTVIQQLGVDGRFEGPHLVFSRIAGTTPGNGSITGSGTVTFTGGRTAMDLSFNTANALLLNRDDVSARGTGTIKVQSGRSGGTISGDLHLNGGRFTLGKASAAAAIPQLNVKEVGLDQADLIQPQQLHPWKLDVKVAGGNLQVVGLGIDSIWTTNLQVGGSADSPAFTGRASLVRGDYEFAGKGFRLDRGTIRFRGESPPDPLLDIHASTQVQGLDASVTVTGTGLKPDIQFASVPALPQDELLSRLLFGTSITNLSAPEALQLAAAVAALQSGNANLNPINALRSAIGLDRLRIVPADISTGQKTAVAAGKYIGRKLYVEVVTDGHQYSATNVEYQITRWLSVLSTVSTIGRASANVRVSKDY